MRCLALFTGGLDSQIAVRMMQRQGIEVVGFHVQTRKDQLRLGCEWNLLAGPEHTPGCLLLQESYAQRLKRLLALVSNPPVWQIQTLSLGRHFTLEGAAYLIVAKNASENERLKQIWKCAETLAAILLEPANFRGPSALISGSIEADIVQSAANLLAHHGKDAAPGTSIVNLFGCPRSKTVLITAGEICEQVIPWK